MSTRDDDAKPLPPKPFAAPGDDGALVFDKDGVIIGMLVAPDTATPVEHIEREFGIKIKGEKS